MLHWLGLMIFFSLDLHAWMLLGLKKSYVILSPGAARLSPMLLSEVITRVSGIFLIAFEIAAPVMGVSFVITFLFALLGRVVPQMNVLSESFPVRAMAGLFVLGSTITIMGQHILHALTQIPKDFTTVLNLLAGA